MISGYVHDLEAGDVVSYLYRGASGSVRLPDTGLGVLSNEKAADGSWALVLEGWRANTSQNYRFNGHDSASYTTDRPGPYNKCHLHGIDCGICGEWIPYDNMGIPIGDVGEFVSTKNPFANNVIAHGSCGMDESGDWEIA